MRKMASVSTLGAVKYTSRREAQTKAAAAQARLARAETRAARVDRRTAAADAVPATGGEALAEIRAAGKAQREEIRATAAAKRGVRQDAAAAHIDAYFDGTLPKWRLTTGERLTVRKMEKARDAADG